MDPRQILGSLGRNQILPPAYQGEDLSLVLGPGTFTTTDSPSGWSLRFTLLAGGTPLTITSITATVTGSAGAWSATFSIPLINAQTILFSPGVAQWQLDRTDSGSAQVLATGSIEILGSLAPLP